VKILGLGISPVIKIFGEYLESIWNEYQEILWLSAEVIIIESFHYPKYYAI